MSTSTVGASPAGVSIDGARPSRSSALRTYFASDRTRTAQTVLGLIWVLVGALKFQSFTYGHGFIQMLTSMEPGQPHWLSVSIGWGASAMHSDQALFATLSGLLEVGIGVGLLYRPLVKPALLASFAWAFVVWWFGEAFGMLFMNMASPLTGAPGTIDLYAFIGLMVWPNGRPGGLLGVRGARIMWAVIWVVQAYLWLLPANSSANATANAIKAAPSGMSWLSTVQLWATHAATGNGLVIAIVLAALSLAIGVAVGINWRSKEFLLLAVILNVAFWVLSQGFGSLFEGNATDPDTAPLLILMAYVMYTLVPFNLRAPAAAAPESPSTLLGESS